MPNFNGMSYIKKGCGEPILLLHGWGANKECFAKIIEELSTDFTVYAIDFLGFGASNDVLASYTIFDFAKDVERFINIIIGKPTIILGHSFGGRVCMILGQKECVKSIIFVNSAGLFYRKSLKTRFKIWCYKRRKRMNNNYSNADIKKFGSADYVEASPTLRRVMVRVVNTYLDDYAKKIDKPTLIIWGKKDKITPFYMAKTLHKYIKCSTIVSINGGHFCFLEDSKAFCASIFKFLMME